MNKEKPLLFIKQKNLDKSRKTLGLAYVWMLSLENRLDKSWQTSRPRSNDQEETKTKTVDRRLG